MREGSARRVARRRLMIKLGALVAVVAVLASIAGFRLATASRPLAPPSSEISAIGSRGDWPMYGGGPAHSGAADTPLPQVAPGTLWTFETRAPIIASPAIAGGVLFLATGDRRIVALDAESGRLLWEHPVAGPVNSSPAVAGEHVFVGLRDGRLLSLDRTSGELQWQFRTGNPVFSSPAVYKGAVYIGSDDGNIYSLDAQTGELRWR